MGNSSSSELPLAGAICLGVLGYTCLILIIVFIRYICMRQGKCQNVECGMCGKEGAPQCSQCCISCSEMCGCSAPSVAGCLNSCCPNKKLSCVDVLLCQCCLGEDNCFTKSSSSCDSCYCNFSFPQCEAVSCCCIEIKLRQPSLSSFTQQSTVSPPSDTPARNAFSPPSQGLGQQSLFKSSASDVVTTQVHVNRAFDDSMEKVERKHLMFEVKSNSKLKAELNRNSVSKVTRPTSELSNDPSQIQVKGRKIRQKKDASGGTDKVESQGKSFIEEINPKKKCRKKTKNPNPLKPREVSTTAARLVERKLPSPPEMLEAQSLPSSSIKSSISHSSQSLKKVTWRKQPIKPAT